jgi:hypothetical protein
MDWSYQSNSNSNSNQMDWSYQPNSDINDTFNYNNWSNQLNSSKTNTYKKYPYSYKQLKSSQYDKSNQRKKNKTKLFRKIRKENKLYGNVIENLEIENENIRQQLRDKDISLKNANSLIDELDEENYKLVNINEDKELELIKLENKIIDLSNELEENKSIKENLDDKELIKKLQDKNEFLLDIISKWQKWFEDINEENV